MHKSFNVVMLVILMAAASGTRHQNATKEDQKKNLRVEPAVPVEPAAPKQPAPQTEKPPQGFFFASTLRRLQHHWLQDSRDPLAMLNLGGKGKLHQQPAGQEQAAPQPTIGQMIANMVLTMILFLLVAYLYTKHKPEFVTVGDEKKDSLDGDFKHGLCNWFETPGLALFTCCCGGVRWADNLRMMGLLAFVYGVVVFVILRVSYGSPHWASSLPYLAFVIVATYYRQKIREAFNMPTDGQTTALDCLKYCFCGCCAIVQDTRQIEEAKLLGHDAVSQEKPLDFSM